MFGGPELSRSAAVPPGAGRVSIDSIPEGQRLSRNMVSPDSRQRMNTTLDIDTLDKAEMERKNSRNSSLQKDLEELRNKNPSKFEEMMNDIEAGAKPKGSSSTPKSKSDSTPKDNSIDSLFTRSAGDAAKITGTDKNKNDDARNLAEREYRRKAWDSRTRGSLLGSSTTRGS